MEAQLKMFLIDSGLVSRNDILSAEKKGGNLIEELVSNGKLSDIDAKKLIAHSLGMPFVTLTSIDPEALAAIPEPISRKHNIVAYKKEGNTLEVAILDPSSLKEIEFLKHKILPRMTDLASMKRALLEYQKLMRQKFGETISRHIKNPGDNSGRRVADTLLQQAMVMHAADIVIEPRESDVLVRFRIGGMLHEAMILPKDINISGKDFSQNNIRVFSMPTQYGEKLTVRIQRPGTSGFSLEELGFHGYNRERIWDVLKNPKGLIIAAGPRSSGKTATLYTLLDLVSSPHASVGTIEEPIEYLMKHISQSAASDDLSLSSGLRNLLKQDTDIIMVSSVSDKDTLALASRAAMRGRPIFTSVSGGSVHEVLQSLKNLVTDSIHAVQAVIFQRLIRKLGNEKESYYLTKEQIKALGMKADMDKVLEILKEERIGDDWENIPFFRPVESLSPKAYSGRTSVSEVWHITPAIADMVGKSAPEELVESQARKDGAISLFEDGLIKAAQGIVSLDEVRLAL